VLVLVVVLVVVVVVMLVMLAMLVMLELIVDVCLSSLRCGRHALAFASASSGGSTTGVVIRFFHLYMETLSRSAHGFLGRVHAQGAVSEASRAAGEILRTRQFTTSYRRRRRQPVPNLGKK